MIETEKGKRMEQILATGATREQLAEALWCAERSQSMWKECAEKRGKTNAKLRKYAEMFAKVADEVGCDHCPYCDPDLCDEETDPMKDGCRLYEELRELGVTDD